MAARPSSLFATLLLALSPLAAAHDGPEEMRLVDRVVAVVDEDPILLSDVERAIALGLVERDVDDDTATLRRRALDGLIEQRIRLHEIGRFAFEEAPLEEVDRQVEALRARFADEAAFAAELERLGIDFATVRQIVARQLAVLTYVEERLGPRVFVGVEEIRRYYDDELTPKLAETGASPPPIEDVREQIRAVLRERLLNEEIERWTEELRRAADVIDLLDADPQPLPPIVLTLPED